MTQVIIPGIMPDEAIAYHGSKRKKISSTSTHAFESSTKEITNMYQGKGKHAYKNEIRG